MKVKAAVSFAGAVTMHMGETADIPEGDVLNDLLECGYVEPAEQKPDKAVKKNEGKRNNP